MKGLATHEETKALTINGWNIFELRKYSKLKETKDTPESAQNRCRAVLYDDVGL